MKYLIVEDGQELSDRRNIIETESIEDAEIIADYKFPKWILIEPVI